jgi:hypothetical protein
MPKPKHARSVGGWLSCFCDEKIPTRKDRKRQPPTAGQQKRQPSAPGSAVRSQLPYDLRAQRCAAQNIMGGYASPRGAGGYVQPERYPAKNCGRSRVTRCCCLPVRVGPAVFFFRIFWASADLNNRSTRSIETPGVADSRSRVCRRISPVPASSRAKIINAPRPPIIQVIRCLSRYCNGLF